MNSVTPPPPTVVLMPTVLLGGVGRLADMSDAVLDRLARMSVASEGMVVFPATVPKPDPAQRPGWMSSYTSNQAAAMQSHWVGQVLAEYLVGTGVETLFMSDFRTDQDDVAVSFDVNRLAGLIHRGFCGVAIPATGKSMFSPGPQLAELCKLTGAELTVLIRSAPSRELDGSDLVSWLRLADCYELPSTPFASAFDNGIDISVMSLDS